jgi:hypothetical protein
MCRQALVEVWLQNRRDEAVPLAAAGVDDAGVRDDRGDGQQRVVRVDNACRDACTRALVSSACASCTPAPRGADDCTLAIDAHLGTRDDSAMQPIAVSGAMMRDSFA